MLLALLAAASGAAYDPDLTWRTLETEHFNITFHQGEEQLANELGLMAEDIHDVLTADMQNTPNRPTEVVLVDHTDVANGYAMRLPVNTIVIFVTAPQEASGLALYEDWLETIFTHEYAHILHLDTVRGPVRLVRYALGRIVSTNDLSPWWIVEGSATFQETRHTTGGRGRSPHTDMILRMAVLEDGFPELGQMDGFLSQPPGGNARYLFGESFLSWIVDHTSEDALTRWNLTYGSWVPYWLPAKQVFGDSFRSMYKGWRGDLEVKYAAQQEQVAELGLTWANLLLDDELDGTCSGPRFSPDGESLAFSCNDRRDGANVYLADGEGENIEVEVEDGWAKTFGWRPDGQAFAYSSTHVVNDYNLYEDVYFHELGTEKASRLTSGKRARDPEFSPDGADLLVVTNEVQNNNLARMRIDQTFEALTEFTDHTQLSTPRYSPDGRFLALSAHVDGDRDIWVFRADGTPYRRVTLDMANDRDPTFSADGDWLFFSSDRTGIANIYAVELETERLYQVTNVISGAFQPTVRADFGLLAWQHYTHNGYRVATMPIDVDTWWDRGELPRSLEHSGPLAALRTGSEEPPGRTAQVGGAAGFDPDPGMTSVSPRPIHAVLDQPVSGPDLDDVAEAEDEVGEHDRAYAFDHPVRDYDPKPTLFPPRYVLPTLYSTTTGFMGALSTSGMDTLRRHGYSAFLTYRTDARYVGGGASYTYNRWKPIMAWGAQTYTVPYGSIYRVQVPQPGSNVPAVMATDQRYWDQRIRFWSMASTSRRERTAIFARYTGVVRRPQEKLGDAAYRELLPTRGFLSTVGAGWRYARGKVYTYSIAPEDARVLAVTAEWTSPQLGSYVLDTQDERVPFNRFQLTGEVREYVALPWADNHVLAVRGAAGISAGDQLRYGAFRLGGNYGESGYYNLPDEWKSLRGYPVATVSGNGYYLASAEYRLPLRRLDWGPGTLPLFLRTLHGAAFIDVGDAFDEVAELSTPTAVRDGGPAVPFKPPHVGVGAELRLGTIVGWGLGFDTRAGYAVGLTRTGYYNPTDLQTLYFRIGSSF